jgi:hypothetical protein
MNELKSVPAVVVRHIALSPVKRQQVMPLKQVLVPVRPKQKQNLTFRLSEVMDLFGARSRKKPSIMVKGVCIILMEQKGTNAKGLMRVLCEDGGVITLLKDASVTVVDAPMATEPSSPLDLTFDTAGESYTEVESVGESTAL